MSVGTDPILKLVRPKTNDLGAILADIYRALKAIGFYPAGHPKGDEILASVYDTLRAHLQNKELALAVSRAGFSIADQPLKAEANQMIATLANELFIRRVQQLAFLPDLTLNDLRTFLQLLSLDPKLLNQEGGMAQIMPARGIRTIWVNEIDLTKISEKRNALDQQPEPLDTTGDAVAGESGEAEAGSREDRADAPVSYDGATDNDTLMELLARMDREKDDSRYQQLACNLVIKAKSCMERAVYAPLFLVLHSLVQHSDDLSRSQEQRNYAVFTLEQITEGVMMDFLLQHLENNSSLETPKIYPVLKKLGSKVAYVIIQRLCLAEGLHVRKNLAAALLAIGTQAVPPLVAMLKDERWYVVRNMVAILGQIGCRESIEALKPALYHGDQRVRKETLHALVKIGGSGAETMIVELLDDGDSAIVLYAIMSLGLMKSTAGVPLLIQMLEKPDFFSKHLKFKKEAITALGRIGDRRTTLSLLKVLQSNSWLPWSKWDELKTVAAIALGRMGDESALPTLKAWATRGGPLGKACSEAVDNIERVAEGIYD